MNEKFVLFSEFPFSLPDDYDEKHQLFKFIFSHSSRFKHLNEEINFRNFAKVSHCLVKGRVYTMKIWSVKTNESATIDEWGEFLAGDGVIAVEIRHLTVAYQQNSKKFPLSKYVISITETHLYKDDIRRPGIRALNEECPDGQRLDLGLICSSAGYDNNFFFFGVYDSVINDQSPAAPT